MRVEIVDSVVKPAIARRTVGSFWVEFWIVGVNSQGFNQAGILTDNVHTGK